MVKGIIADVQFDDEDLDNKKLDVLREVSKRLKNPETPPWTLGVPSPAPPNKSDASNATS